MPEGAKLGGVDLDALHEEVSSWLEADAVGRTLGTGGSELESIALGWLTKAGKRWRPFLVVTTHAALSGRAAPVPEEVKRLAVAVECIHKASLIYDDIQDADDRRYGDPTVHREHGVPVALTVALLLLGHGYRLIADCGAGPEARAQMASLATGGHCDLCLGQGSELLWMRSPRPLGPDEVLEIFRWKTAPSFEVVFRLPAILAGAGADVHAALAEFSTALGVAYQIQDDIQDFHGRGDVDDVAAKRPSIVLALAHERATGAAREAVARAWCGGGPEDLAAARRVITETDAERGSREVLGRYRRAALDALRPLASLELKALLARVTEKVLPGA